ncbi:MAG TPA: 50S ribosomal protein L15 [Phycisphaerales bacterium]|nr:50S ribosomal protein L15 [Phycisphaerales bacterium]
MMIHEITKLAGKYKARKRIGRGEGSGHGKTSGKGHKGASSRSGYSRKRGYEGGQMPYFRRLPKRGFANTQFATEFWIVNLCDIVAHPMFARGGEVTAERLVEAGLIRDAVRPLKVLGDLGESKTLSVKLTVKAARVSASVRKAVTGAGGSITETGTRRDRVRGVDLTTEDRKPTKLTKKPLRRAAKKIKPQGEGKASKEEKGGEEKAAKPEGAAKPDKGQKQE